MVLEIGDGMSGMVSHLYVARRVLEEFYEKGIYIQNIGDFMIGSIIPDFAKNKESAHHYPNESNTFFAPNLQAAKPRYSRLYKKDLVYGIMLHLRLDERNAKEFLDARFDCDASSNTVTKRDGSRSWTLEEFFSYDGLYHGYSETNPLFFEKGLVEMDWLVDNMPALLPRTGLYTLDQRTTDDWFRKLNKIISDPPEYTGELFSFDELIEFLDGVVENFVSRDFFELCNTPYRASSGRDTRSVIECPITHQLVDTRRGCCVSLR